MNQKTRTGWILAGVLTGAVGLGILLQQKVAPPPGKTDSAPPAEIPSATAAGRSKSAIPSQAGASMESPEEIRAFFDDILAGLSGGGADTDVRALLEKLRDYLFKLGPDAGVGAVSEFLDKGADAVTGLDFAVAENGFLASPSSMRVALMDYLAQINPQGAADLGRRILEDFTTADEWAVSMRNVARGSRGEDHREYLAAKAEALLDNASWRKNPTAGFFEAFDVFVYTESTRSVPKLARLFANEDRRDLTHAAYLTLDRLTLLRPAAMMEAVQNQPELLASHGPMVANFMARGDLRDSQQRAQMEQYLLSEDRTESELAAFVGIYPNNNLRLSNNLLTQAPVLQREEMVAHDLEALRIVQEWVNDARFEKVKPHLHTMRNRLTVFVNQAANP